ncbi:hypothetical protein GALMADRAFT_149172 [Galerina marginata CBS 339.88]|uniref:Retrovirus-related Pol polyprotein from transposon TNT 1-94-like beta-barrel domain-containing protein n=1 Tax=Galerina marginata (strain CBS 339.88) TaxID=685588 RepID=A0A067S294_GALM3|nr:hypothetical protein GALMADRAFT_149172 [Galerina marginata CBS 339.88]
MPSKRSSTKSSSAANLQPKASSSRRKSKTSSPPTARTAPHYLVVDLSLPSHIINDRSLFASYTPSRKLHRTVFGTDVIIEGYGDVLIRAFAGGKSILFRLRDCWHVPSSPHHFLSCTSVVSQGKQVMLAGRTPRMIYSHKDRLAMPELPKYVPFAQEGGHFVLKFQIPVEASGIQPAATPPFSLHALPFRPFAGLSFNPHSINSTSFPASPSPLLSNSSISSEFFPLPSVLQRPITPLSLSHLQPHVSLTSLDVSILPLTLVSPPLISAPSSISPRPLPPQSMSFLINPSPSASPLFQHLPLHSPLQNPLSPLPISLSEHSPPPETLSPQTSFSIPFQSLMSNSPCLPPLSWYFTSSLSSPTISSLQHSNLGLNLLPRLAVLFNHFLVLEDPP